VISGHVNVGAYSFIGVNATLRNAITIGEACLIGAGSIVMKDTRPGSVYVPDRTKVFSKTSDGIDL
jgi:acetyltransferase-like isoleucine patch superfamily enzyme